MPFIRKYQEYVAAVYAETACRCSCQSTPPFYNEDELIFVDDPSLVRDKHIFALMNRWRVCFSGTDVLGPSGAYSQSPLLVPLILCNIFEGKHWLEMISTNIRIKSCILKSDQKVQVKRQNM